VESATLTVNSGGDLQAALNAAQPGDEVVLQAGARFSGAFRLPAKPAGPPITVRSSAALPSRRLTPSDAALLPTLVSGTVEAALTATSVANWRLDGLRFESNSLGQGTIIALQDVTNITLDRLLIVGGAQGQKRAIMGNGRQITLTRSHIANIWTAGQDSQAFCAWDGAGPYTITDNYLEAASENVMFGGADSAAANRIPSDILVENNHFSKRLEWKGQPRVVKNLFELKAARRVTVRNNLFEHNWTDGQSGTAIVFTVRNQDGTAPWSVVEDVLFERNTIRDTEGVFNILGYDDLKPSGRTTRITLRHNIATGSGVFLMAGGEVGVVTIDHNTIDQGYNFATLYKGGIWPAGTTTRRAAQFSIETLTVTNTLGNHNQYGVFGEDAGIGTPALNGLTRGYTWTHNVLAGESGWAFAYPPITWQPSMADHRAQFTTNYALTATSAYRNAGNDGLDLGAITSTSSPPPPPPPPPEICGDAIDNDGDGLIDEGCAPPAVEVCGDGIDNDGDGLIDEGCAPPPPLDTTGPVVTLWNVSQNPSLFKFRVQATDPSGIASVRVEFQGAVVASSTTVPLDVAVSIKKLKSGTYEVRITVTDRVGNSTVQSTTIVK
jgi:Big-like domain-containing protein